MKVTQMQAGYRSIETIRADLLKAMEFHRALVLAARPLTVPAPVGMSCWVDHAVAHAVAQVNALADEYVAALTAPREAATAAPTTTPAKSTPRPAFSDVATTAALEGEAAIAFASLVHGVVSAARRGIPLGRFAKWIRASATDLLEGASSEEIAQYVGLEPAKADSKSAGAGAKTTVYREDEA